MPNSTWDELETFIRAETGISKRKLFTRQLSLENDLDLTGDEAYYFMEKFFDNFKVRGLQSVCDRRIYIFVEVEAEI
jgi:hypothetical protein